MSAEASTVCSVGDLGVAHITVQPSGVCLAVAPGDSLFSAAREAGYKWPTTCQGRGSCRMCFMSVLDGADVLDEVGPWEAEGLDELGAIGVAGAQLRLACQAKVRRAGDLVVFKRGVRPQPPRALGDDT